MWRQILTPFITVGKNIAAQASADPEATKQRLRFAGIRLVKISISGVALVFSTIYGFVVALPTVLISLLLLLQTPIAFAINSAAKNASCGTVTNASAPTYIAECASSTVPELIPYNMLQEFTGPMLITNAIHLAIFAIIVFFLHFRIIPAKNQHMEQLLTVQPENTNTNEMNKLHVKRSHTSIIITISKVLVIIGLLYNAAGLPLAFILGMFTPMSLVPLIFCGLALVVLHIAGLRQARKDYAAHIENINEGSSNV